MTKSKRRTRKQKEAAQHSFTISWDPGSTKTSVKSQKREPEPAGTDSDTKSKYSVTSALMLDLASIKKDIFKSIFISLFIITFEIVIYFFWK